MSSLSNYFRAQAETQAARNLHNYAGVKLELAKIMERYAEIQSQHEPIHSLSEDLERMEPEGMRFRLEEIVKYVITGRMSK